MAGVIIVRLEQLPLGGLRELVVESEADGLRFVRRLVEEWQDGRNRFGRPGEGLFAAFVGTRVVGVCGLNNDPYAEQADIGRVPRLYVLSAFRRQRVGHQLVQSVVAAAKTRFRFLRLRTESAASSHLYQALGFRMCSGVSGCTHCLELKT